MALEDLLARAELPEDVRETIRQEIADRRRAEAALGQRVQQLDEILDAAPGSLYLLDSGMHFVDINRAGLEIIGKPRDEVIGKHIFEIVPGIRESGRYEKHLEVMRTGRPFVIEDFVPHPVFGHRNVLLQSFKAGAGLAVVAMDVTDLRRTEARFRSLIEQTTDAVFCYGFDPPIPVELPVEEQVRRIYGGVLLECNAVCARSYGAQRPADVIGKKLTELFGTAPGSLDRLFLSVIEGGYRIVDGEGVEKLPDGSERHFLNNAQGVVEHGRLLRIWGTFRDITDRKRLELQLRESEKLATMGEIVGAVAHEVRNPLFAMSATIDAFEAKYARDTSLKPYCQRLRTQLERMSRLMQDLLDYGRPSSSERVPGSLLPVLEEAVAACRTEAQGRTVELELTVAEGLPQVDQDRRRLVQAFENVIRNAVEHSPEGGRVRVSAKLDPAAGEPRVECAVRDAGPGFSDECLARAFEPFYSQRPGGTGLGLAIAWRVLTEHQGTIGVGNAPDGGGMVTVRLPVRAA